MKGIIKYETPGEWCEAVGVKSYHPLIAVINYHDIVEYSVQKRISSSYYIVTFYRGKADCCVEYGHNTYEYSDRSILCLAPGQITTCKGYGRIYYPERDNLAFLFHPDYIRNSPLGNMISEYRFFHYQAHHALRVSESEIEDVKSCFALIDKELKLYGSEHSHDIVCSVLSLLLDYCNRMYIRQYQVQNETFTDIVSRFEILLNEYLASDAIRTGLPTVGYFAQRLNLTPDYLSSLLRKETGKNASEHIQYRLLELAKDRLCSTDIPVSQVAYELGFEYPQYFGRIFKKLTGFTPNQYRIGEKGNT